MKCVFLLSDGIDSPVATYVLSRYVDEMILLHADIRPFTDDRMNDNVHKLVQHLHTLISCPLTLMILPHGKSLSSFKKTCLPKYTCVFCKRMLVRYASEVVKQKGFDAIVMGDSLGQVASQTLQNINCIDQVTEVPILRPLISFDKTKIIQIAKKIGTFDLSIAPSLSCMAVPNKPSTMACIDDIKNEENKIDCETLVKKAVENADIYNV